MILIGLYGLIFPGDLYIESVGRNAGIGYSILWAGIGVSIILIGRIIYRPSETSPPINEVPKQQ